MRPLASHAGRGAMWFDTDIGHAIWSDGERWVDAMGRPA